MKRMMDVLERFKYRKALKTSNIKEIIVELARLELIQKPHLMSSATKPEMMKLKEFAPFQRPESIIKFYDTHRPTPRKILDLIQASPQKENEREVMQFLRWYIRGLDPMQIQRFLRFVTGADVITVDKIEVNFVTLAGAARRPVARTCAPVLELPCSYENFCELCEDFQNILAAGEWQLDFV